MWRDAALVAGKDLRIEARSRVGPVPGGALRHRGPGALRLRPRPGPRGHGQGRPGPVLGRRPVLHRAGRPAQRVGRVGRRRPRRAAAVRHRPGRPLPGQGGGRRPPSWSSWRPCWPSAWSLLYGARIEVPVDDRRLLRARHGRPGRHRHPLRRPVLGPAGPRDAAALPPPAHRRAGAAGRHPDLAGRHGRRHPGRRHPVAAAARACSTPSTWPSAWSSSAPSRRRHDTT